MDKLEFAVRRYKQLLPEPIDWVQGATLRQLLVWLTDDVSPVVEQFVGRPKFREQATWVLSALAPELDTQERRQIEAVEESLVVCARALSKLAAKSRIAAQLVALNPPESLVVEEAVVISGRGTHRKSKRRAPVDVLAIELAQVAEMAKHPWKDLINPKDYFEPQQEFVQMGDGSRVQRGEFIVSLNPELHPVGNFVVRCMFRRLDGMLEVLDAVRRKVLNALRAINRKYRDVENLERAWLTLQSACDGLRQTFQTGPDNQVRDSCMILTQVYAVFHPAPQLKWLNVPSKTIENAVPALQHRIKHFHNGEMFDRIAAALGDLKLLYEGGSPDQSAMDESIAAGWLVIDQRAQDVFWQGKPVKAEWRRYPGPWELLNALAGKVGHRGAVTESALYPDRVVGPSTMGTRSERLKKLLPPSLRKLITPGGEPRSYRLDLPAHHVRLFK